MIGVTWWSSPDRLQVEREQVSFTQFSGLTARSGCWQLNPEEEKQTMCGSVMRFFTE